MAVLPPDQPGQTGPLPLHPMNVSDILDASFQLLRANFRAISIIIAVLVVPIQLLGALAARCVYNGNSVVTVINNAANGVPTQTNNSRSAASTISTIATILLVPFAAGAISKLVADSYLGIATSPGEALRAAGRRYFPLLFAWILVHLMEVLGLLFFILPGLLVMSLSVAVVPAIVMERLGPVKGIRRSWGLDRRRLWGILGIALLTGGVFLVVDGVVGVPFEIAGFLVGLHWGWILLFIGRVLSSVITLPLGTIVATLVYFDGRIRNEGFDLQILSYRLNH
jgi:hypothetical protein